MTGHPLGDLAVYTATVLTALGITWRYVIGRPIRRAWALNRALVEFLDDWRGRPARPGHPSEPGVMERLTALEQLKRNGGNSVADKVHRTDEAVSVLGDDVEHLKDRAEANASGIAALHVRVNGVDQRVTDHRAAQAEQARLLAERLERMEADRFRAETYAASLQELGLDVVIPKPEGGSDG